jgi:hypothetical protein
MLSIAKSAATLRAVTQKEVMTIKATSADEGTSIATVDRACRRILAEIHDGLRHGFFKYTVTCEVVAHGRRRLTFTAGKSHQFVIPKDECDRPTAHTADSCNGSDDQ